MAGDVSDMVFTDPPYNVDYEGYTEERLKIKGDRMSAGEFKQFLESAFHSYRTIVKPGASIYICHSSSWQREFQDALELENFEVRCQIIWAKNTFAWGFGRYKFQHEPIFYAHVAGEKDSWFGDKSQSTLWNEKKPAENRILKRLAQLEDELLPPPPAPPRFIKINFVDSRRGECYRSRKGRSEFCGTRTNDFPD